MIVNYSRNHHLGNTGYRLVKSVEMQAPVKKRILPVLSGIAGSAAMIGASYLSHKYNNPHLADTLKTLSSIPPILATGHYAGVKRKESIKHENEVTAVRGLLQQVGHAPGGLMIPEYYKIMNSFFNPSEEAAEKSKNRATAFLEKQREKNKVNIGIIPLREIPGSEGENKLLSSGGNVSKFAGHGGLIDTISILHVIWKGEDSPRMKVIRHADGHEVALYPVYSDKAKRDKPDAVLAVSGRKLKPEETANRMGILAGFMENGITLAKESAKNLFDPMFGHMGLRTREYLKQMITKAQARQEHEQREGEQGKPETRNYLIQMDMAHLKLINELHGYSVGNDYIATLIKAVQEQTRPGDSEVGKIFSGDELGIVVKLRNEAEAKTIIDRIQQALYRKYGENIRDIPPILPESRLGTEKFKSLAENHPHLLSYFHKGKQVARLPATIGKFSVHEITAERPDALLNRVTSTNQSGARSNLNSLEDMLKKIKQQELTLTLKKIIKKKQGN